jgi:hypothetical protein
MPEDADSKQKNKGFILGASTAASHILCADLMFILLTFEVNPSVSGCVSCLSLDFFFWKVCFVLSPKGETNT